MKILLIDNYDSFVFNLARFFECLGCETDVVRNDVASPEELLARRPEAIVLSPGPCTPAEAGVCLPLLRMLPDRLPVLGVCLGHQAIITAAGGQVGRAAVPTHGRASLIYHRNRGVHRDLPNPFHAGRYHSLIAHEPLPPVLQQEAWLAEGGNMAVSHRHKPIFGVQYHPESILTPDGGKLIANFTHIAQTIAGRTTQPLSMSELSS